jgi:hypothetical protein
MNAADCLTSVTGMNTCPIHTGGRSSILAITISPYVRLSKVTYHDFHHIYQSSFYHNNPDGHRNNVSWLGEGMAEYYRLHQAIKNNGPLKPILRNRSTEIASMSILDSLKTMQTITYL